METGESTPELTESELGPVEVLEQPSPPRVELLKFTIVATLLNRDERNKIVGEQETVPMVVYGIPELIAFGQDFIMRLATHNAELAMPEEPVQIEKPPTMATSIRSVK